MGSYTVFYATPISLNYAISWTPGSGGTGGAFATEIAAQESTYALVMARGVNDPTPGYFDAFMANFIAFR